MAAKLQIFFVRGAKHRGIFSLVPHLLWGTAIEFLSKFLIRLNSWNTFQLYSIIATQYINDENVSKYNHQVTIPFIRESSQADSRNN